MMKQQPTERSKGMENKPKIIVELDAETKALDEKLERILEKANQLYLTLKKAKDSPQLNTQVAITH